MFVLINLSPLLFQRKKTDGYGLIELVSAEKNRELAHNASPAKVTQVVASTPLVKRSHIAGNQVQRFKFTGMIGVPLHITLANYPHVCS